MPRNLKRTKGALKPVIPIDWKRVDELLYAGCTTTEIAAVMGCSDDTLRLRCRQDKGQLYTLYAAKKRARGDTMLREAQFKTALGGDRTLQIWLGKNRLHQRDDISASDHLSEARIIFEELGKQANRLNKDASETKHPSKASDDGKIVEIA